MMCRPAPALVLASLLALSQAAVASSQEVSASLTDATALFVRADALLVSPDSSFELGLEVAVSAQRTLSYVLRDYVRDPNSQRAVFAEPIFDRGDTTIRKGAVAYFKYHDWPTYEASNVRGSSLDSPFTWEDLLDPGLSGAYEVAAATYEVVGEERLLRCELRPRMQGGYSRIDLWLRLDSAQTVRRLYYSPSGKPWKNAVYGDYRRAPDGNWTWRVRMTNEVTGEWASLKSGPRRREAMPDVFFEPTDENKEP